jgi:hypothetical protein
VSGSPPAGLCADCVWARRIVSKTGSMFLLCRRSETDPDYAKYPRLPVLVCPGHEPPQAAPMP